MPLAVRKDLGSSLWSWADMENLQTCPQVTTSNIHTKKAMEIKETLANLLKMKSDMKEKLDKVQKQKQEAQKVTVQKKRKVELEESKLVEKVMEAPAPKMVKLRMGRKLSLEPLVEVKEELVKKEHFKEEAPVPFLKITSSSTIIYLD